MFRTKEELINFAETEYAEEERENLKIENEVIINIQQKIQVNKICNDERQRKELRKRLKEVTTTMSQLTRKDHDYIT